MHCTSNISLTLSNFSFLKKGSVCALYLLRVIIRMAPFCNLIILLVSKPQQVISNCKWGSMSESYISLRAENGKYRFNLFITPNVRDILLVIFEQWLFQLRDPLIVNPRKLNPLTLSITESFMINLGISSSHIIFWLIWKTMNFVFEAFRDSLLTDNQFDIAVSSWLIASDTVSGKIITMGKWTQRELQTCWCHSYIL